MAIHFTGLDGSKPVEITVDPDPTEELALEKTVEETLPALAWFGATISPVGMQFPTETTQEDWEFQGAKIALYERGRQWAIGDWLNFGEQRWGEMYVQAAELFHLDKQTLMNLKSVALRFPIERRHPRVSWSQHAEVAKMSPEEQDYWLGLSEQNEWTREELRAEIKRAKEETLPGTDVVDEETEDDGSSFELKPIERVFQLVNKAYEETAMVTVKSLLNQAIDLILEMMDEQPKSNQ